jgi:hypothetical protein
MGPAPVISQYTLRRFEEALTQSTMFGSQLAGPVRTTMLWGSDKKKAAKPSNPWVISATCLSCVRTFHSLLISCLWKTDLSV